MKQVLNTTQDDITQNYYDPRFHGLPLNVSHSDKQLTGALVYVAKQVNSAAGGVNVEQIRQQRFGAVRGTQDS